MKFLSTSAFHPLAFMGLLLVTATAFPASQVLREDATDNTTSNGPTYASTQKAEDQISYTLLKIKELRDEMCGNEENCVENDKAMSENDMNLPEVPDGCSQSGNNRDSCLLKVTSGLLELRIYLKHIQNTFQSSEKNNKAADVASGSDTVLKLLIKEVNETEIVFPSPTANAILVNRLQSQNEWEKNMTIYLVLGSLEEFLQFSKRVLRKV